MPMVAPNDDPDDPNPSFSKSCSSKTISRKKDKSCEMDDDVTMDGTVDQISVRSTRTTRNKAEREEENELRLINKPYSQRLKFDSSLKWNGTSVTFRTFSKALEGQLVMGGATYMISHKFIST